MEGGKIYEKIILLIVSIISVLSLTGCNVNQEEMQNNNGEYVNNGNTSQNSENISGDKELEELVEKYKLSENYILKDDEKEEVSYNILSFDGYDEQGESIRKNIDKQEIASDGVNFKIECYKINEEKFGKIDDIYEIKINDEILEIDSKKVGSRLYDEVGIIDLNPLDDYKEIVVRTGLGVELEYYFFRLTKGGIKYIYNQSVNGVYQPGLIILNNRYIIPETSNLVMEDIVRGYYIFEDDEFKYVDDRFLTGEKIKDENGEYPEDFKNQVFTANAETRYQFIIDGNEILNAKIKLLRENEKVGSNGIAIHTYDIELAEDVTIHKEENGEVKEIILSKGTIYRDL